MSNEILDASDDFFQNVMRCSIAKHDCDIVECFFFELQNLHYLVICNCYV